MKTYLQTFLLKKSNIVTTIVILSVLIAITGYFYYHHESRMIRQERENELKAIASMKSDQISKWYQDEIFDAKTISNNVFLLERIENWLSEPSPSNRELLNQHISAIISEHDYEDILLTTTNGQIILSSDDQIINADSVLIQNVKRTIDEKILTMVDFYHCSVHNKIHIDFISPVFNSQSIPKVVMVFQISPEKFLFPLIQSWPLPSKSSETLIVRQDGDSVLFLNELRHRTDSALKLRVPLTNNNVTAVQAVLGYQGILRGIDYRGEKVLADIRAISGTPWFMISKIDESELFAELHSKAFFTVLFFLLIILFVAAGLANLYSYQQRNMYRNLYQSQEEFRTTLYCIGDAVITTDKNGNVKHLNPVAEQLTGWREKQARGKSLEKVFNIINETTRQKVENPVTRILEKGMIIGLANHTLLISKDKREIPIADSGAPIKDESGNTIGVVLVFRDQTEERQAQKA
ncbi:MAG: PAS domain S-box protein, partial [Fidelibacterota bacterium]